METPELVEANRLLQLDHAGPSSDRVVLLSGGVDSYVTLLEAIADAGRASTIIYPLAVDYGQKCLIEHEYAKRQIFHVRQTLPVNVKVEGLHVMTVRGMIGSSMLAVDGRDTDKTEADELQEPSPTNVPSRNALLLSLAYGYAEAAGAGTVWAGLTDPGCHGGPSPDARIEFARAMELALSLGSADMTMHRRAPEIITPLSHRPTKLSALVRGVELGMDIGLVWSCYAKGPDPCGRCSACGILSRAKALLPSAHELVSRRTRKP